MHLLPPPSPTSNSRRRLFSVSVTFAMVAVVCTWPDTVCPPISSPTRALRSKLTSLPGCRAPRFVRRSVSAMTSNRRVLPSWEVTVRQVPLMATLAPIATSVARAAGSSMSKQQNSVLRSTARTVALPCTMPAVNSHGGVLVILRPGGDGAAACGDGRGCHPASQSRPRLTHYL